MAAKIKNQDIAKEFINHEDYKKNLLFCTSWNAFLIYTDNYYKLCQPNHFETIVWRFIDNNFKDTSITMFVVRDIVAQIKIAINKKIKEINTPYIAFNDKLYNIEKFEWEDFDRNKISIHKINFNSNQIKMKIPKFQNFLRTTLINSDKTHDQELIKLIQEMFGHYLTNSLRGEMAFFLVGEGANGKSVMSKIIKEMIGEQHTSAETIEKLTTNQFAAANLVGKKMNICSEEESRYLKSDRFKALVTNDMIETARKFEQGFSFKPLTKYLFLSNRMPNFEGLNYGLKRRLTIIPFNKTFNGNEKNIYLVEELKEELPGIINWSIEGAKRLKEQNYEFTDTHATNKTKEEFEEAISSPVMFFREGYEKDDDEFIQSIDLYKEYQQWCIDNGKKPMSKIGFSRDITKNLKIKTIQQWDGRRNARGFGMSLKREIPPETEEEIKDLLEPNQHNFRDIGEDSLL